MGGKNFQIDGFLKDHFYHPFPESIYDSVELFLQTICTIYLGEENQFRIKIATNYLQNHFLNMFDKISQDHSSEAIKMAGWQNDLFKRCIQSVQRNCCQIREVAFYANDPAISTRYLSAITQKHNHISAKAFIDDFIVQEIKLLLHSSGLSIQETTDRLHLPDQSYMGRFFKKKTGISPNEYRKRK